MALLCCLGTIALGVGTLEAEAPSAALDLGGSGSSAVPMEEWPLGPERDPSHLTFKPGKPW